MARPPDLLDRDSTAPALNRRWVADTTYARLLSGGFVHVAFVVDVFSRMIVGWSLATHLRLPARVSRAANLIVASLYVPYSAFNAVGESWTYFYGLSVGLEVLLLAFVLRSAWAWPRTSSASMPEAVAPRRPQTSGSALA